MPQNIQINLQNFNIYNTFVDFGFLSVLYLKIK